jgi:hypothetical protein
LLLRLAGARLRLYEVEEVRRDEGFRLLDLRSGSSVWVREKLGTHEVGRWDILAARISPAEDGVFEMEGGSYLFRPPHKAALLAELRHLERRLRRRRKPSDEDALFRQFAPVVHGFWLDLFDRPLPRVVTTEGDDLVFSELVFDVLDEPALRAALETHPAFVVDAQGGFVWIEGSAWDERRVLGGLTIEGRRLTLMVTSRQRADRGRVLLEGLAGSAVRYRVTGLEGVGSAVRRRDRPPKGGRAKTVSAQAADVVREVKHRHYATWADVPLPALDGRTPRHAATLKTLRPRLVELLKFMENAEARQEKGTAYDFGWLWRELGLDRPS